MIIARGSGFDQLVLCYWIMQQGVSHWLRIAASKSEIKAEDLWEFHYFDRLADKHLEDPKDSEESQKFQISLTKECKSIIGNPSNIRLSTTELSKKRQSLRNPTNPERIDINRFSIIGLSDLTICFELPKLLHLTSFFFLKKKKPTTPAK